MIYCDRLRERKTEKLSLYSVGNWPGAKQRHKVSSVRHDSMMLMCLKLLKWLGPIYAKFAVRANSLQTVTNCFQRWLHIPSKVAEVAGWG